ncbi:MAG: hypothetical protein GY805_39340, partial [Chloroflexi bacterium]|nr:hypothetical protein [Chloroflexota bacterium]
PIMSSVNDIAPLSPPQPVPSLPFLLDANQYEQTIQWLQAAQQNAEEEGDLTRATLIAAAHNLCEICLKLQNEAKDHYHTYQQALTRNNELEQQLIQLLQLLQQPRKTAVSVSDLQSTLPAKDKEQANLQDLANSSIISLWQRIQQLLGWLTNTQPPEEPGAKTTVVPGEEVPPLPLVNLEDQTKALSPSFESAMLAEAKLAEITDTKNGRMLKHLPVEDQDGNLPNLIIYCLGAFRVYQNDLLINDWNGLKGQMILKYLVAYHDKPISKDMLMDVFWPDADTEAARRNLHQAVYSLRQTLKEQEPDFQHIIYENDCYLFNSELNIWLDFQEFEQHVQNGRRLIMAGQQSAAMAEFGIAEALFQGNFMSGDLYEEWLQPERERLRNLYLDVTDCLSNLYLEQREFTIAIALSQNILRQDNCFEQAYFRLMRCYQAQGQRHLAIRYFLSCKETLAEELGLMPTAETVELYRELIA